MELLPALQGEQPKHRISDVFLGDVSTFPNIVKISQAIFQVRPFLLWNQADLTDYLIVFMRYG